MWVTTATPGAVARSGVCAGIELLGMEDAQVGQKSRSSGGVGLNRAGEGYQILASGAAPKAFFLHIRADLERDVAADHKKTARGGEENSVKEFALDDVMRSGQWASPWPSRRGSLPVTVAWIRRGNDGSANAGGPTTSGD